MYNLKGIITCLLKILTVVTNKIYYIYLNQNKLQENAEIVNKNIAYSVKRILTVVVILIVAKIQCLKYTVCNSSIQFIPF